MSTPCLRNQEVSVAAMTILKATELIDRGLKTQCFNLNDIAAEARRILAEAEVQRERILAEAQAQAAGERAAAREQAYQEGREAGLVEGRKAGKEQALVEARAEFAEQNSQTLQTLREVLGQFDRIKHEVLWRAEQDTVRLALAVAEKVIKRAGLLSPDVTSENVRAALALLGKTTDVTIQVHSRDLESIKRLAEAPEAPLGRYETVSIEADDNIEPGGCRVLTHHGIADAQLDTQLQRISDELLSVCPRENENT